MILNFDDKCIHEHFTMSVPTVPPTNMEMNDRKLRGSISCKYYLFCKPAAPPSLEHVNKHSQAK